MLRLNAWTTWCLIVGVMGQVGYLAPLLQGHVSATIAVPVLILPVALVILIQPGDGLSPWLIGRVHRWAALGYAAVTVATEILAAWGYTPHGALFFRLLMHLGWLPLARLFLADTGNGRRRP